MSRTPVVIADRLSKSFVMHSSRALTVKQRVLDALRGGSGVSAPLEALRDVSFTVAEGESVALIGRNGSGKSTLLKLIAGIHHSTGGRLLVRSGLRIATMIELGVGFHPEMTGRENVYLNASIHGLSREQIDEIYPKVVTYAELEKFIDTPIKTYSSGMVMRLGFATGISLDPDVFLLDEIFAVGDEAFQEKCLTSMRAFRDQGRTMFFVSHSADAVREMCARALVLDSSRVVFDGDPHEGILHYRRILSGGRDPLLAAGDAASAGGLPPGWHRMSTGGIWEEARERHFEFLREHGLDPTHRVLDMGCGALRTGVALLKFLKPGRYVGVDHEPRFIEAGINIEAPAAGVDPMRGEYHVASVVDVDKLDGYFDVIFANALLQDLQYELVARTLAAAISKLAPSGQLFVAYLEAPSAVAFDPVERPGGSWSFFDQPPRHYDYATLAHIVDACGGRAERLGEWSDPHGQMMMVVTREPSGQSRT